MKRGVPLWLDDVQPIAFPELAENLEIDVAIVGAGVVGLHCAYFLRQKGVSVALFEARAIGHQATGRSTAKVTSQHGLKYHQLSKDFGHEAAATYATANERAVALIAEICGHIPGGAALEPKDAYVFARGAEETERLEAELEVALACGLPAEIVASAAAPVPADRFLKFRNQYQFDPYAYLTGLAALQRESIHIFERSRVTDIESGKKCVLTVNGHQVTARHVVVATQMPVTNHGLFYTKAFPLAHAIAAIAIPDTFQTEGMFISAGSPSASFRTASRHGRRYLLVAGPAYKPGDADEQLGATDALLELVQSVTGTSDITHLWTNEDFRPMDGIPFVGPASASHPNILVATGFDAWGITQGVVAGDALAMAILAQQHPMDRMLDPSRVNALAGGPTFLKENAAAAMHLVQDRLLRKKVVSPADLRPGDAAVVSLNGEQLALRLEGETAIAFSAVCPHLGCIVDWNDIDRTWDCPCHGSRFDDKGEVLAGPATSGLERKQVDPAALKKA